jgi:hypothetical protein
VERKYGRARRVWVFDRGIVSEENLALLRRRGGQYLVGTPRSKLREFERELLAEDWLHVRADVEVKLVAAPGGEETYILCRSSARKEKEQAIRSRFSARMEKALTALQKRVAAGQLRESGSWAPSRPVIRRSPICMNCASASKRGNSPSIGTCAHSAAPGSKYVKARICCAPILLPLIRNNCGPATSS